ncbi:methyltransferase domain-containing protein [Candidatus Woesearchaeota archaeon]|jgi:SAM-dependent methyltransferase|nr:methyltransferase domain-containing protein [Candidatus Woesearchaeota archaeon]MBT6518523.1 methyltransferase domain-containing protein [Candidatus Woesearchaeota archaeon]MBT7368395.1 methyltransferase domain-containing protein [Candidatus Woesearchaeota archaeon]
MILNPSEGKTFGNISKIYNLARPDYPEELIDDITKELKPNSKILDVGCGTGQATKILAKKGFQITGTDLSEEMITIAKTNCPNANFLAGRFEDIDFNQNNQNNQTEKFDLITSGMAWHWLDKNIAYKKAHDLLNPNNPNSKLAIFWSYQEKEKSEIIQKVGIVLDKYSAPNRGPAGSLVLESFGQTLTELKNKQDLFNNITTKSYQSNLNFTKQKYIDLVISYGWVQNLENDKQSKLIQDLNNAIEPNEFTVPYKFILITAKKK